MKYLLILALLLFNGCGVTTGNIGHQINTNVNLSQANFKVLGITSGTASATYFLGIGPSRANLFSMARRGMVIEANLVNKEQKPRAIINVTTDIRHTGIFPIVYTQKIFVSGEVIEFIE